MLQAIRQNYANPEFAQELRREASAATQQATRERQKQVTMLEQQKADLEKARDRELNQLRDLVAAASPDVLEHAAAELLAIDKGFLFLTMVRTKSGSDSTVNPEIIITGVIFHPTRIER